MTTCGSTCSTIDYGAFHADLVPLLEPLYGHAIRLTRNHADAEDLLQDTMVKACANLRSRKENTNLHGWLFRIMTNTHTHRRLPQATAPTRAIHIQFHRRGRRHPLFRRRSGIEHAGPQRDSRSDARTARTIPARGLLCRRRRLRLPGDSRPHADPDWHRDVTGSPRAAAPAAPPDCRRPTTRIRPGCTHLKTHFLPTNYRTAASKNQN